MNRQHATHCAARAAIPARFGASVVIAVVSRAASSASTEF